MRVKNNTMALRLLDGDNAGTAAVSGVLDEFPINHHAVCVDKTVRIRAYRPGDRATVRQLCCDTGFLGQPIDSVFQDRELFADLFTNAYLAHEPEYALIAEVDGRVVGYLLGAASRHFELALMRSGFKTATKMVFKLLTGRYAAHPRSALFVRWLLTSGLREQPKHPANAAHLHWDIDKRFRGRGISPRLWHVYEQKLREVGIKHCYGAFFSHARRRPEAVYARYGFKVYDRKQTTLFKPEIAEVVEVVCVHKGI